MLTKGDELHARARGFRTTANDLQTMLNALTSGNSIAPGNRCPQPTRETLFTGAEHSDVASRTGEQRRYKATGADPSSEIYEARWEKLAMQWFYTIVCGLILIGILGSLVSIIYQILTGAW